MGDQWDAMRTQNVDSIRVGLDGGSNDVEIAKHCRSEKVETGSVVQQIESNIPSAHVSRRTEGGLEVAAAPIPATVDQRRLQGEQFFYTIQITVGVPNEVLTRLDSMAGFFSINISSS